MKVVRAKRQPQRRGTGEAVARPEGPGAFIGSPLISAAVDAQGNLIRKRAADDLGMSGKELAETVGIRRDTLDKASRANAPRTQARVREMVEIVDRVKEWAGGKAQAPAWYRAQPIPAFGGRTAESLVKEGKAAALRDDLDQFAPGGFA